MEQNRNRQKVIGKLTISFGQDGEIKFYPVTDKPELLAEKFGSLVQTLHDNPYLVAHIFRICERHVCN